MTPARSLAAVPTLAELLADPARVVDLPADAARVYYTELASLQAALLMQAVRPDTRAGARDRLLTVKDAAAKLGQSVDYLYKHAGTLPFAVRNGRALRFSEAGIETWIRRQQRG